MTPKEKAVHLINKYNLVVLDTALGGSNRRVKQCAIIAVDEIVNSVVVTNLSVAENQFLYWEQVKKEINNI